MPREKRQAPEGKPSARQEFKEMRRRRQRNERILTIAIIAGIIAVVVLLAAGPAIQNAFTPVGTLVQPDKAARPMAQDNAMGDPNAPVKIEEFSDFQCPYCKRFSDETEELIIQNYVTTGKVYFVYRSMDNWVSDNMRGGKTESRDAAEAAYCAGEQNKYWEYHDILFANWNGEDQGAFLPKRLEAFGQQLGLNMSDFRSCLSSDKFLTRLQEDRATGNSYGITGTPSFVINGQLLEGAQPFSVFQEKIEAALAAAGK